MSRISYRNYPSLKMMGEKKDNCNIMIYEEDAEWFKESNKSYSNSLMESLRDILSEKTKVQVVSKSFINASKKAYNKISDIINDKINNEFETLYINECFIIDGFIIHTKQRYSPIEFYAETIVFEKGGYLVGVYKTTKFRAYDFLWETISEPYFFEIENIKYNIPIYFTKLILNSVFFKKYASVEIIESKAKSKKVVDNCKYLNETDLDIEYLDSKWFTTLVNSQGFKVRGFFRLQPKKKNGEWTKELIWIDEFEKQGYNRQAKILNNK